jgi:hypothetical protein
VLPFGSSVFGGRAQLRDVQRTLLDIMNIRIIYDITVQRSSVSRVKVSCYTLAATFAALHPAAAAKKSSPNRQKLLSVMRAKMVKPNRPNDDATRESRGKIKPPGSGELAGG